MDILMDASRDAQEPDWLEKNILGEVRVWQVMFICFAGVTSLIVMVCCCFRFRIPRTKQQIDYQRRKITCKFRQQLETIQDANMDAMSLHDVQYLLAFVTRTLALELLHEKTKQMEAQGSQPSSITTPPQQNSMDASSQPSQKPEPQASFAKLASKVANLSKLGPKSPTSPTPSGATKMDF